MEKYGYPPDRLQEYQNYLSRLASAGEGCCILIPGEPSSKANSRRNVTFKSKAGRNYNASIKSQSAMDFVGLVNATKMMYASPVLYTEPVCMTALIWYGSLRKDLDESMLMDSLQGRMYENDRQIRFKIIIGSLDKSSPRSFVFCEPLQGGVVPSLARFGGPLATHKG